MWVNKKSKKIKDEIKACDLYLTGATKHNAKRDEESQNWDQFVPNRSCAISMIVELYEISMQKSDKSDKSDKSSVFVGYVWAIFLNFVGLFPGMKILL